MVSFERCDALVIGARCAGAATAMLLARAGLRVLMADRGGYGTDTVSTHALMRGGVLQLHRWGILPQVKAVGTPAIRSTTFHYGDEQVAIPIKASDGVDALYAPRRTLLDALLVDAACEAGVRVRHGQTLVRLSRRADGRVCGGTLLDADGNITHVAANLVIGADGAGSSVARLADAATILQANHTTAVLYGHFAGIGLDGYHWWYRPGIATGTIPTNGGLHCVFAAMPQDRLRRGGSGAGRRALFDAVLAESDPFLAASVAGQMPGQALHVFGGRTGFLRQACGRGWALVGDAGYFKDPLTAHGITDALRDAELLANAVRSGRLTDYAAARDTLSVPLFAATDEIASLDWSLDQLKALHHTVNQAMKREVEHLRSLDQTRTTPIEDVVS